MSIALGMLGCSRSPSTPSVVPQAVSIPNPPVVGITGFVADTGFRIVAGALVEVVEGLQAGVSTTSDATGRFSLSGTFDNTTRLRVSKEGHVAATQLLSASQRSNCPNVCTGFFQFYLELLVSSVNIGGDYTLTFIADNACTVLPAEARTRAYAATITPASNPGPGTSATEWRVVLSGAQFLGDLKGFRIGAAGDYLAFALGSGEFSPVVEQLATNSYLAFSGFASTTVAPGAATISASFDGLIEHCVTAGPMGPFYNCDDASKITRVRCDSRAHRLVLTRR